MKKSAFLFAALLLSAAFAQPAAAQTLALHAPAPAETARPQAEATALRWSRTAHEFGQIPQNVPVTATFEFKNTSRRPVQLTQVQGSCGCTATSYTKEAVKPGQKATITATFNAAAAGSFNKTVTVTNNLDANPQVLTLRGVVVAAEQ